MAEKIVTRAEAMALGLKRFFSGKCCKYGHLAERLVSDYSCVECSRLQSADPANRARRREYMRDHQRRYREDHPERVRATLRKSYAKHAEKRRQEKHDAYAADPGKFRLANRKNRLKNGHRHRAAMKAWREANQDILRMHRRNRKAKLRNAEGKHTAADIERLFDEQCGKCAGCGETLATYHVDHVMPVSRGGSNWPSNLQLLCPFCNVSKGAKTMDEWLASKK